MTHHHTLFISHRLFTGFSKVFEQPRNGNKGGGDRVGVGVGRGGGHRCEGQGLRRQSLRPRSARHPSPSHTLGARPARTRGASPARCGLLPSSCATRAHDMALLQASAGKTNSFGEEGMREDKPSEYQVKGWRAVSATGVHWQRLAWEEF